MNPTDQHDTTKSRPCWPTIRMQLSRLGESEDSIFVQMERYCPMARGQRCLVLAPSHEAVVLVLEELSRRISSLNPRVDVRLARAREINAAADLQALADETHRMARDGRHVVVILESLDALLDKNAEFMEACKRLFGSAQATEDGGTVTIIAGASDPPISNRDQDILYQFKGTGNMEVRLRFDEARSVMSVDPDRSGTKHAEMIKPAK